MYSSSQQLQQIAARNVGFGSAFSCFFLHRIGIVCETTERVWEIEIMFLCSEWEIVFLSCSKVVQPEYIL